MQLEISGHHLEITPALESYVTNKVKKLEKLFNKISHAHITLIIDHKKKEQTAEGRLNLSGTQLFAVATSQMDEDMYAAIDALAHKLKTQVIEYKEKIKNHGDGAKY